MRPGYRVVWAQCWGVPPQAWDVGNLRHIVAAIGELVDVDDDVEDLRRLDRARVLIRTPWSPWFNHTVHVSSGGESYEIHIVEEASSIVGMRSNRSCSSLNLSDDIDSDDIVSDEESAPIPTDLVGRDDNDDDIRKTQLPSSPCAVVYPVGKAQGDWAKLPTFENSARSDTGKDREQPPVLLPTADLEARIGEEFQNEGRNRKDLGGQNMVSEMEGEAGIMEEEVDVELLAGPLCFDREGTSGPHKLSILPRGCQIRDSKTNREVGNKDKEAPATIAHVTQNNFPPASDTQHAQLGPLIGKAHQHSNNNPQHLSNSPTKQFLECGKEWKVFVRRKGCKQNLAQQSQQHISQSKFHPMVLVPTHNPSGSQHQTEDTAKDKYEQIANSDDPNQNQLEEAAFQWEIAKLMGVHSDSDQATIIHKIVEMETRDSKEAEAMGNRPLSS